MQKLKVNAELWANVETFMPPRNICSDAPAARIQQQVPTSHVAFDSGGCMTNLTNPAVSVTSIE